MRRFAIIALALLSGCGPKIDQADGKQPTHVRQISDAGSLSVESWTDPETGCEYLVFWGYDSRISTQPRFDRNERLLCSANASTSSAPHRP